MSIVLSSSYVAESIVSFWYSLLTTASCLAISIPVVRGDFPMAASAANSPLAPLGQIVEWSPHHSQSKVVTVCRNFFGLWLLKHWKIRIAYRQWRSHKGMCTCIHRREPEWTQIQTWETTHGENGLSLKQGRVLHGCSWQRVSCTLPGAHSTHVTLCDERCADF